MNKKNINEIDHITYNTGNSFKFNPLEKINYCCNRQVFKQFKKSVSKGRVIEDVLLIKWRHYLISISAINEGIYNILICHGIKRLTVNIFSKNKIYTLLTPDSLFYDDMVDVAQIEQLIACYLFFHPISLNYSNFTFGEKDIPKILEFYLHSYCADFQTSGGKRA